MDKIKTIEKIRKMLALSRDAGASEAEAALAAEKAQEILFNNDLTMAEVDYEETSDEVIEEVWLNTTASGTRRWHQILGAATCKLYACSFVERVYHDDKGQRRIRHTIFGRQSRVAVCVEMMNYFDERITTLENGFLKKLRPTFRLGCATGLALRLTQRQAALRAGANSLMGDSTLPALASMYDRAKAELNDYFASIGIRIESRKVNPYLRDPSTFRAGVDASDVIGLDDQIGHRAAPSYPALT